MATDQKILQHPEQLVFIDECLPQLMAGEYSITADLHVEAEGADKAGFGKAVKNVWVGAPRFTLEDAAVYTMYPPKDASGYFEATLPQIVFNRRTLPWERTIDGALHSITAFKLDNASVEPGTAFGHAPWMALLLFSEVEMSGNGNAADAVVRGRKSLKDPGTDVFVPELNAAEIKGQGPELAPWEDINNEYDVIDIPLGLFKKVVPAKADLPYLAHVRKTAVDAGKESAAIADNGYFATLIGNRLPVRPDSGADGVRNSVFLVSLEGYHGFFKKPEKYIEDKGKGKVRLVILQSWSFTIAPGNNFRECCEGLHVSPFKMNYPEKTDESLKKAYDYGYALLPHITRNGAHTYSWYRGPFNPNFLPASAATTIYKTADAALRFDAATGLADVSYAAAWQLGRLLALKDKTFSTALYQWKLQGKRKVAGVAAKQQASGMLPAGLGIAIAGNDTLEETMKGFLAKRYNMESGFDITPLPFSNKAADTLEQLDEVAGRADIVPDIPAAVTGWLGRLFLLEGVPVNYLIPHEDYLIRREGNSTAREALGTFYIDYDWIEALLGGALSIVAHEDSVALLNTLKDGKFLPAELRDYKKNAAFIPSGEGERVPLPDKISGHITGFFLRSQLISGWKGIKVFARDETDNWMKYPLRIERLAEDIQLCVFAGKVQQILFIQPPEGIHFGIENNGKSWQKSLRNKAGDIGTTAVELNVTDGVLGLANAAAAMAKAGMPVTAAASFAFQMLENPVIYKLNISDHWKKESSLI